MILDRHALHCLVVATEGRKLLSFLYSRRPTDRHHPGLSHRNPSRAPVGACCAQSHTQKHFDNGLPSIFAPDRKHFFQMPNRTFSFLCFQQLSLKFAPFDRWINLSLSILSNNAFSDIAQRLVDLLRIRRSQVRVLPGSLSNERNVCRHSFMQLSDLRSPSPPRASYLLLRRLAQNYFTDCVRRWLLVMCQII